MKHAVQLDHVTVPDWASPQLYRELVMVFKVLQCLSYHQQPYLKMAHHLLVQ